MGGRKGTAFDNLRKDCKKRKVRVSDEEDYEKFADKNKTLFATPNLRKDWENPVPNIAIREISQLEEHMLNDPDGPWAVFRLGLGTISKTCFAIAQTDKKHNFFFTVNDARSHFRPKPGNTFRLRRTGLFYNCLPGNESGILSGIIEELWMNPRSQCYLQRALVATGVRYTNTEFKFTPTHLSNKTHTFKCHGWGHIEVDALVTSQADDKILVVEGKNVDKEVFKGQIANSYMAVRKFLDKSQNPLPEIIPVIVLADPDHAYICELIWDYNSAITEMKIGEVYRVRL